MCDNRHMLTPRDFLGNETYLAWLQDYEQMRQFRNAVSKRRPNDQEIATLQCNKPWEAFYRSVLRTT